MYDIKWDLKGYDAVIARMRSVPVAIRGKAGRSALGSAARVVTNTVKANALKLDDPTTGRVIANNVTQRSRGKYFRETGDLKISVGVAYPKGRIPPGNPDLGPKGPTPHWHLLEMGTEKMRARPFVRPALGPNVEKVQTVFASKLDKAITKLMAKK